MIVVTTDYDPTTQSLALVATRFVTGAGAANAAWPTAHLSHARRRIGPIGPRSTRPSMHTQSASLVFFGHGYDTSHPQPGFHGQDQAPALDPAGAAMLKNRVVVAVCCYSLNAMATAAQPHRAHDTRL